MFNPYTADCYILPEVSEELGTSYPDLKVYAKGDKSFDNGFIPVIADDRAAG